MPRKRKNIHSLKKEAKIRTRLIELTMKVEDLIYQKEPITEAEAEKFLREVCSYKTECHKNARSLQVIEKLTRYMKTIIAEHQEQRLNSCKTNDNNHYPYDDENENSVSPVYSLPDDDRTQFTQEDIFVTEAVNNVLPKAFENDYDNTQFTQGIHKVPERNNKVIDVINLCDGEDNKSFDAAKGSSHIHVDMHKALSNLSIHNIANDEPIVDIECSQSILNNFKETNITPQFKTVALGSSMVDNNVKPKEQNQTPIIFKDSINILKPIVVNSSNITTTFKNYDINNPLVLKVSKAITNTFNIDKPVNSNHNIITPKILDKVNVNTNTTNISNCKQQNNTPIINNTDKINPTVINKTDNATKVIQTTNNVNQTKENNSKNDDSENYKNDSIVVKKKRGPRKKKEAQTKVNINEMNKIDSVAKHINKNSTAKIPNKTYSRKKIIYERKDSLMSIYNKNVENDLSWLEGIRYVREIGDDEYDKLQDLSEDFWTNYYLPPHINDNDFL